MRRINFLQILCVFFLMLAAIATTPQAKADDYHTYVATPTISYSGPPAAYGYPADPVAFSRVSIYTGNASTSAIAVTALAGRKRVTFKPNANGVLWVSLGNTAAAADGSTSYPIPYGEEKTFEYDADIAMSYVSTAAISITIVQEGRNPGN